MSKTILEVTHNMAQGLYKAGGIDTLTMKEFDALCLPPVKSLSGKEITQSFESKSVCFCFVFEY